MCAIDSCVNLSGYFWAVCNLALLCLCWWTMLILSAVAWFLFVWVVDEGTIGFVRVEVCQQFSPSIIILIRSNNMEG